MTTRIAPTEVQCEECATAFVSRDARRRFCSQACRQRSWRRRAHDHHRAVTNARRAKYAERQRAYEALYRNANRGKVLAATRKYKYGITAEELTALDQIQAKCCGICRGKFGPNLGREIDHDHETGRVRGYLCRGCNARIRGCGDTVAGHEERLRRLRRELHLVSEALAYLVDPPAASLPTRATGR